MRQWVQLAIIGTLSGMLIGLATSHSGTLSLIEVIRFFAFGEYEISVNYLLFFVIRYFHFFLFQAMWGVGIYKHFCTASVYYFSRVEKRSKWFLREAIKLFVQTLFFGSVQLISSLVSVSTSVQIDIDMHGILVVFIYLLSHTLWLYAMTLLVNVMSICLGSSKGFLMVASFQIIFIGYFVLYERVVGMYTFSEKSKAFLLKVNPLSHLVLKWHSCKTDEINIYINDLQMDFRMEDTIIFFSVIILVILLLGMIIVKRKEFIVNNSEV